MTYYKQAYIFSKDELEALLRSLPFTVTCITTETKDQKESVFMLEVGKDYPVKDRILFNNKICYVLGNDPIGALYPVEMFEIK